MPGKKKAKEDVPAPLVTLESYCRSVEAGDHCKTIQHMVQRFRNDIKQQGSDDFPYYFDEKEVVCRVLFCGICKHFKGDFAGKPFIPEPWQVFIIANIFGWKRKDNKKRRFRYAYIAVPRKNGKTFLAASISLSCFVLDGEAGAEIYSAATKRDQAKIVHTDAKRIVRKSPDLRNLIQTHRDNLFIDATACKFEPVGANADSLDGLNPHMCIVDELHAHPNGEVWGVLETGIGARTQPLMLATTTAGHNAECFCKNMEDMCANIIDPDSDFADDQWFAFISHADPEDDWRQESTWRKANPNFGVSVQPDDMKTQCRKAQNMGSEQNQFLTKRLNIWVNSSDRFIDIRQWDACPSDMPSDEELKRMTCIGGLDLSTVIDLTAFSLLFRDGEDRIYAKTWHWIPEESALQKERDDKVPYRKWEREGLVYLTPGNSIDYRFIREQIVQKAREYGMERLGFDPYNATHLVTLLTEEDGLDTVQVRQGSITMSPSLKDLERRVASGLINHGGNPMLRWQAGNLAVKRDHKDNLLPMKVSNRQRIDGMASIITGLAVMNVTTIEAPSIYEPGSDGMLDIF